MPTINSVNTSPVQYNIQVGSTNGTTANIAPSTSGFILTSNGGSAAPTFQAAGSSSITITGDSGGGLTGSSFTFTGGATGLTFAGSGTTETLGGTVVVAHGGTGAVTLTGVLTGNGTGAVTANAVTQHGIVIGGASNAVTSLGSATNGQLAIGSTGANPVLASLTSAGSTIAITPGAGSISLDVAGTVATTYSENTGSAAPSGGTLNIRGDGLNTNTTGSGSTVVVHLDNTITLGSLSPVVGTSVTVATGGVDIQAGNLSIPVANSGATQGIFSIGGHASIWYDDSGHNWIVGPDSAGAILVTGTQNSLFGASAGASLSFGSSNTMLGNFALASAGASAPDTANQNTAVGHLSLTALVSGSNNIALGYNSASAFVGAESDNITIGSIGVAADSGVTRIGTNGTQTSCFVAGIDGVNVGSVATLVTEAGDQLGTAVLTAGTNITITPGANTITIDATGTLTSIDITGDSGGTLTGSSFTFTGGATGLTFAGAGTTETLGGTVVVAHGGTGAVTLTGVLTGNGTGAVTAHAVTQHGVLIAGASNAVNSLGVATNGQLVIGSTGADPVLAALTSTGGSISITNGAGSINLESVGGGFTWTDVTGGSATLAASNGYLADSASLTTFTMPTNNAIGDTIKVVGLGSGGWTIVYGTGQFIKFGSVATTADTGSLSSTLTNDSIELICTTPSATAPIFTVVSSVGNLSYV